MIRRPRVRRYCPQLHEPGLGVDHAERLPLSFPRRRGARPAVRTLGPPPGEVEQVATPTLMIQGADDRCDEPSGSAAQERFFTGGYRRVLLDGVGHFPHREAPDDVALNIDRHLEPEAGR
jgi:pimeloyl-ACP methyl ester carboxylesterase